MICLCDFRETMTVVGTALPGYMAYRMDDGNGTRKGRNDMRIAAGLGACSSCDYCLEHEGAILLVEDTRTHPLREKLGRQTFMFTARSQREINLAPCS